jgi:hypothetical protein
MKLTKIVILLTAICLIQQPNIYAEKWTENVIKNMKDSAKISRDYLKASINETSQTINSLNAEESACLFTMLSLGLIHAMRGEKQALLCVGVATIATMVHIYIFKAQLEQLENVNLSD